MIIVLTTTLVLGGGTGPLVKALGLEHVPAQHARSRTASQASQSNTEQPLIADSASAAIAVRVPPPGQLMRTWKWLDRVYLREWFGGNPRAAAPRRAPPAYGSAYGSGSANLGSAGGSVWCAPPALLARRASSRVARLVAGEAAGSTCRSWTARCPSYFMTS